MTKKGPVQFYKIELDPQQIAYVLAAIEWRIEYYEKRIKAIDDIQDKLDNYSTLRNEAQTDKNYHSYLKDWITKQIKNEVLADEQNE